VIQPDMETALRAGSPVDPEAFITAVLDRLRATLGSDPDDVARAVHRLATAATRPEQPPLPLLSERMRRLFVEVCLHRLQSGSVPPWSADSRPLQDGARAEAALAQVVSGPLLVGGVDKCWIALLRAHLLRVYLGHGLSGAELAIDQGAYPTVGALVAGRGWLAGAGAGAAEARDWNVHRLQDVLAVVPAYVRVAIWDAVRVGAPLAASASEAVITSKIVDSLGGLAGFLDHATVGSLGLFHLTHSFLVNCACPPARSIAESRLAILEWAVQNFD